MTIYELQQKIMQQALKKGFGTKLSEVNVPEKFALLHSEVSEAYQAFRQKKLTGKHGLKQEIGDILQRLLHLAGLLEVDLEKEVMLKLKTNKKRIWDFSKMNEGKK